MAKPILLTVCVLLSSILLAEEPRAIETTQVDAKTFHGGTFQSHNQKVIYNDRGIFMTHVRARVDTVTKQKWILSWSQDSGKSFKTLYESIDGTNGPALETDSANNIYLCRPDFGTLEVFLYRFLANEDYREPHITRIPKLAAGKYASALDEKRGLVYYTNHNGILVRYGMDGSVQSTVKLLTKSDTGVCEYPHLLVDGDGILHAAWTSLFVSKRRYWSIHHLQSRDAGISWEKFDGTPVALPVIADEKGPADRITLDDEYEASTWLSNFHVKNRKAHFLYLARTEPPRQHYVRYDLGTGKREIDMQPSFRGEKLAIHSLDGFFASRRDQPDGPLYCVGSDLSQTKLVCLMSRDNGATWHDYAVSSGIFSRPYAIGGCREITPDGWLIGSFTEVFGSQEDKSLSGNVHFIRIKVE